MEQKPVYRPSALVGVIVIVLCLLAMVVIYKLTVGQKVSREAPTSPETVVTPQTSGPGGSHAQPGPEKTPVPKPAGEKKPLPPGG